MSRQRLFGTDGVRGRAGEFLTPDLALGLARAAVTHLGAVIQTSLRMIPAAAPAQTPIRIARASVPERTSSANGV